MPQGKQPIRRELRTHQQTGCLKTKELTDASGHAPRHDPAYQNIMKPSFNHQPLPLESLPKTQTSLTHQGEDTRSANPTLPPVAFGTSQQASKNLPWDQASLVAQMVKHLPAMQETQVLSLGQEYPWKKKWQPTSVFLHGKSHGQRSMEGYMGSQESDTT